MDRKKWLHLSSFAVVSLLLPSNSWPKDRVSKINYLIASVNAKHPLLPLGMSIPFDWPVAEIPANGIEVGLNWKQKLNHKDALYFRITSATDIREYCNLAISSITSKKPIGQIDISYAHYMQPFELLIPAELIADVLVEGIAIKMIKGNKPFYFFSPASALNDVPKEYLPHLLQAENSVEQNQWKKRLLSFASLSTFGWMEGCVLDGIITLADKDKNARNVLYKHLDKYFANNTLVYENLMNKRSIETISTVESILPFAMLAKINPAHAMLKQAIDFCKNNANDDGIIADDKGINRRLKTEECYTISYPLAILAQQLQQPDLQKLAIVNLMARVALLVKQDAIYQNSKEKGEPEFKNWARGVGWYLLGMAKSLAALPLNEDTKPLLIAFQQGVDLALTYQQKNGLWSNFLHQPDTGIDTSGSAAIAAALAYGYSKNLLPKSAQHSAKKSWIGLQSYLTPDGFLKGSAQVNKGGEALQRNGFRVISPYTLGFLGILEHSLKIHN